MNLSKKIISLSLVASIAAQTVSADVLTSALQNYTPPSQVTLTDSSGNAVKTMYYSGGYYFRFNNSSVIEPMWSFAPPKIEAGCNGFNLKGMFVSLLGLDQFGAMLQNAGTTLAWGVAVGLVYSLPGIFNVFKTLNQWAKNIQALLASACESGIAIGQALGENFFKNTEVGQKISGIDESINKGIEDAGGSLGSMLQDGIGTKAAEALGFKDGKWNIKDSWFSFGGKTEITTDAKSKALSEMLNSTFGNASLGGSLLMKLAEKPEGAHFKNAINNNINNKTGGNVVLALGRLIYGYGGNPTLSDSEKSENMPVYSTSIDDLVKHSPTIEGKEGLGLNLLSYAMYYNFVGDYGFSNDVIKDAGDKVKSIMAALPAEAATLTAQGTTPTGETSAEAEAKLMSLVNGKLNPSFASKTIIRSVSGAKPEEIQKFILNGQKNVVTTSSSLQIKKLVSPEFIVLAGSRDGKRHFVISAAEPRGEVDFFADSSFPGVLAIAKCSTYTAFKDVIGEDRAKQILIDPSVQANDDKYIDTTICDDYKNFNFADVSIYKDILAKATEVDQITAINHYKDILTHQIASTIIGHFQSMLSVQTIKNAKLTTTGGTEKPAGEVNAGIKTDELKIIQDSAKSYAAALAAAKLKIDEIYPNGKNGIVGSLSFMELIDKIEKEIQERAAEKQQ